MKREKLVLVTPLKEKEGKLSNPLSSKKALALLLDVFCGITSTKVEQEITKDGEHLTYFSVSYEDQWAVREVMKTKTSIKFLKDFPKYALNQVKEEDLELFKNLA